MADFSFSDLITPLVSTINNNISTVSGVTGYGFIPEGAKFPRTSIFLVNEQIDGVYGDISVLNTYNVQFSTWNTTPSGATHISKRIVDLFQNVQIPLVNGFNVSARKIPGQKLMSEPQKPTGIIYHSVVMLEFRVQV